MQKITLFWSLGGCLIAGLTMAQGADYSVREFGFADVDTRPYRLIMVAQDLAAAATKAKAASLRGQLAKSNIVLVSIQAERDSVTPDSKPIRDPAQFAVPKFWLMAPDGVHLSPFFPDKSLDSLVQSPLRHAIHNEAANALAVVVLLESKNPEANLVMKMKAEKAIARLPQAIKQLDRAPVHPVKLISLPAGQREREQWLLWALKEMVPASDTPKLAVFFGNLRCAGIFEGNEWKEVDLFARIVSLGLPCEYTLTRYDLLGPPLPFRRPDDWAKRIETNLGFDPGKDAVKTEMEKILQEPPRPGSQRKKGPLLDDLLGGFKTPQGEEHQPLVNPLLKDPKMDEFPDDVNAVPAKDPVGPEPSMLAEPTAGVLVLALGLGGWVVLSIGFWFLVRNRDTKVS